MCFWETTRTMAAAICRITNVYAPVFDDKGQLVLIKALQAHQGDTGGKDPGGFHSGGHGHFHRGPGDSLRQAGTPRHKRRDIIKLLERNNRFPSFPGDLAAMIGAVQHCVKAARGPGQKVGFRGGRRRNQLQHRSDRAALFVPKWPSGAMAHTARTYSLTTTPRASRTSKVHVTCTVKGDQLTVDMTGCDGPSSIVRRLEYVRQQPRLCDSRRSPRWWIHHRERTRGLFSCASR